MNKVNQNAVWPFAIKAFFISLFALVMILSSAIGNDIKGLEGFISSLLPNIVVIISLVLTVEFLLSYIWGRLEFSSIRYGIEKDLINIEVGVLNKKYISISYNKIQNINIKQPLLYRIFGLAIVEIETASNSSSSTSSEGEIKGVLYQEALRIKKQITAFSKGDYSELQEEDLNENAKINLNEKYIWIVFSYSFLISYIFLPFAIVFLYFFAPNYIAPFIILSTLPIYFWSKLVHKNFLYQFSDKEIKIYRGVINKTQISIPYQKIQNINISRTLLHRILGISALEIETAGNLSNKAEGYIPAILPSEAEEIRNYLMDFASHLNKNKT